MTEACEDHLVHRVVHDTTEYGSSVCTAVTVTGRTDPL